MVSHMCVKINANHLCDAWLRYIDACLCITCTSGSLHRINKIATNPINVTSYGKNGI